MKIGFIAETIIWIVAALSMVGVLVGIFTLDYNLPDTCWRIGIITSGIGVLVHARRRGY